jgi:hypothetical protein
MGTIPKSNLKMTETVEKSIPLTHMQMITCFLSWLETDNLDTRYGVDNSM